ncbi:glycine zipper 2TM domain-containing protein [Robbsia sp. KACC 23696]|uniref:glycine zipper 2TM domain-containing protein n=1 Tax=Robbsia sp. KACC 23696 TaxID=3149231 RepID=UPI00325ADFFF
MAPADARAARASQHARAVRRIGAGLATLALLGSLSACGGMTPRQRDTAVGAGLGGAAGAALGGGVLGTAGGAAAGGIIGNQMGK